MMLGIVMIGFAKEPAKGSTAIDAVSSVHEDLKEVVITAHEDLKSIASTVYVDTREGIMSLYPDVKSAVIAIGQAIGVTAEHVYTVLVKKFVVDAIVEFLPFLLGIILLGIGWYKFSQYFKNNQRVEWHIIYPCILIFIGLISLCNVDYNTMVMGFFNPEYGALNYILEYSKQMIK